jgi:hypothetical protein
LVNIVICYADVYDGNVCALFLKSLHLDYRKKVLEQDLLIYFESSQEKLKYED